MSALTLSSPRKSPGDTSDEDSSPYCGRNARKVATAFKVKKEIPVKKLSAFSSFSLAGGHYRMRAAVFFTRIAIWIFAERAEVDTVFFATHQVPKHQPQPRSNPWLFLGYRLLQFQRPGA
jgi:hypothetical protein